MLRDDVDRFCVYVYDRWGPMVFYWPKRTYVAANVKQWAKVDVPYVTIEVMNGVGEYMIEEADVEHGLLLCNLIRVTPLIPAV